MRDRTQHAFNCPSTLIDRRHALVRDLPNTDELNMQNVVIEKPYEFVPPIRSNLWPSLLKMLLPMYLKKEFGVVSVECRNAERLKASLAAGHGVLIAPNHCRLSDPLVLGPLSKEIGSHLYAMASWHLFHQDWFSSFLIRRTGAFSVYREGLDRQAINMAIEILETAERPLVIFPEGAISRHNDILMALMDGVAFIARTAAKKRAKLNPPGKVVVHPVAIRYFFKGHLEGTVDAALDDLEHRLTWQRQKGQPIIKRLQRIGEAILALKEVEYFGTARSGNVYDRTEALIDHLLRPLEEEWKVKSDGHNVVTRVKDLRAAILPDMINTNAPLDEAERKRRWRQLKNMYLAQQLAAYPRDYIREDEQIPDRILATVENFVEDLTDQVKYYGPVHTVIQVGEAIEVSPERDRKATVDPVMQGIEEQIKSMLAALAAESKPASTAGAKAASGA